MGDDGHEPEAGQADDAASLITYANHGGSEATEHAQRWVVDYKAVPPNAIVLLFLELCEVSVNFVAPWLASVDQ
jgi:hypothetical protein